MTVLAQTILTDHLRQAGLSRRGGASNGGDCQLENATDAASSSSDDSTWEEEPVCVDSDTGENTTLDDGTEIKLSGPIEPSLENVPSAINVPVSPTMSTPIMSNESPMHTKSEHDKVHTHNVLGNQAIGKQCMTNVKRFRAQSDNGSNGGQYPINKVCHAIVQQDVLATALPLSPLGGPFGVSYGSLSVVLRGRLVLLTGGHLPSPPTPFLAPGISVNGPLAGVCDT